MSQTKWTVTFHVYRQKDNAAPPFEKPHFENFTLEVDPDEYVLDGVERVWAFHDRSLTFRHACHHSTCGACGMRVNGVEKLTCITPIRDVTRNGGTVRVEPLRNFPVVSDLVVDMTSLYSRMELVGQQPVQPVSEAGAIKRPKARREAEEDTIRLADCIECGLCISACPVGATDPNYLGPAVLAAAQQNGLDRMPQLLELVDSDEGVWRCHSAFECTAVCPSFVEPAWRIMDLRKQVVRERFKRLFRPRETYPPVKEATR